ncbi:hypothetical protein ACPPVT_15510 [Angustibacter sp. McL0619]|uniref:hypothetical protein n=1 Tax=Angustibacter sp. McL0619 TaxID=3415676 RepID=UPI003CEEC280
MRKSHALTAGLTALAAIGFAAGTASASGSGDPTAQSGKQQGKTLGFALQRSTGVVAANCLRGATAQVTIKQQGQVEVMDITAHHLPPSQEFDLFVIQVPDAPFGDAWYQGDLESDANGDGHGHYVGRFNRETFLVAPGSTAAPVVHSGGTFPDAASNPASAPVHMFHLGLWFGSPAAAAAAGCPTTVTPFNGDHTAGIQAMSTRQFGPLAGPLGRLVP